MGNSHTAAPSSRPSSWSPVMLFHQLTRSPLLHSWNNQLRGLGKHAQLDDDFNLGDAAISAKSTSTQSIINDDIQLLILSYCDTRTLLTSIRRLNHEWHDLTCSSKLYDENRVVRLPTTASAVLPYHTIQHLQSIRLQYQPSFTHQFSDFRVISNTVALLQHLTCIHIDCDGCHQHGSNLFKNACISSSILHALIKSNQTATLRAITVTQCGRSDLMSLVRQFSSIQQLRLVNKCTCVSDESLFYLLQSPHSHKLQSLALNCTSLTNSSILLLAQKLQDTLHRLELHNVELQQVSVSSIQSLSQLFSLHQLVITTQRTQEFTTAAPYLKTITQHLPSLYLLEIEVISIKRINCELLQHFKTLPLLFALRISSKEDGCNFGTCKRSKAHLLHLTQTMPQLQHVAMSDQCHEFVRSSDTPSSLNLYSGSEWMTPQTLRREMHSRCTVCSQLPYSTDR